ncbi:5-hydroxyisourate hydrolase [Tsukamurella pulmonis]|uniref:5-hydroxyisourate hydrolase n=1 Tax=Tsukamurella pulmonis TaxID=47312 RepID=A0A1H1D873_9ACTN|nr:hydroxyisourate hydrolase [Tsukamurella pulmonis]KXO92442.1 5-hydroxyisourate hydrolase [Tsukamurella pulmonis]RDH11651.1 hydroxyisourate hydrolase [Tsukamurella pulmonis]SDQ72653.1 5-hydroxyisourate hydrolase [Tsukamurella pulmonis]SUP22365.1 5-hydroxyisourate hydrolase precursor [Tsukamurella pulmonis]BDD83541.1 5-hydroxyisourate hydrolase [Tsukamurella pulmonis]
MSTVTTHVLDTARGVPASGVPVRMDRLAPDGTVAPVARGVTDDDGRIRDLGPDDLDAGVYRLTFDTARYAADTGQENFFPEVSIAFRLDAIDGTVPHHHVPLLLSPFHYSTYKGS